MTPLSRALRRGLVAAVSVALLAVTGCSADAPEQAAGPAAPAPEATDAASPAASSTALEFAGPTVDGATFDAESLAGSPVVVWFWAPF